MKNPRLTQQSFTGGAGNDILRGDNLSGSESKYHGTRYNDSRYSRGNDTLAGGKGDDTLFGGYGSDTYIFNKGDGVDTISEVAMNDYYRGRYDGSSRDTIKFGEGIEVSDLNFEYDGNDALVTFKGSDSDKLILKNFQGSTLDKFEFANGDVLSKSDIKTGTDSADTLVGNNNTNIILGNEGDDAIDAGSGTNTINYSLGDGFDTLASSDENATNNIVFGEGISKDNLSFHREDDNLNVVIDNDTNQGMLVNDFFKVGDDSTQVTNFEFADGSSILQSDFVVGDDTSAKVLGNAGDNIIYSGAGDDVIKAGAGDDQLYGGTGNDRLDGGSGKDKLYAGSGDDILKGDTESDELYGESGNDILDSGGGVDLLDGGDGDDYLSAGAGDDILIGGKGDDILHGGAGSNTFNYSAGDGSTNTVTLDGIDSDDVLFSRTGDDLDINFSDITGSLLLDDYFDNDTSVIIEADDDFQLQLSKNSALMREMIAGNADDDSSDGGSVGGSSQITTQVDASQLNDLWIPKDGTN